jgi:hypothetical protein
MERFSISIKIVPQLMEPSFSMDCADWWELGYCAKHQEIVWWDRMGVHAMNKLVASISCLLPKSNDIVFVIVVKGQILVDLSCEWLSIKLKRRQKRNLSWSACEQIWWEGPPKWMGLTTWENHPKQQEWCLAIVPLCYCS